MTLEQLEFAITQYLDGTLPAEDVGALELRLAEDAQARGLLEEHRKLTAMLRSEPLPALVWNELAKDLSAVVTGTVDQEAKAQEQKLNGLLKSALPRVPEVRWDALAAHISAAIDREAAARDESDETLDAALRSLPVPAINWDRLASHISDSVAAQEAAPSQQQVPHMRIAGERERGRERVLSLKWVRTVSQLAVAACVMIAAAIGIRSYLHHAAPVGPNGGGTGGQTSVAVADVKIGGPEKAPGAATAVAAIDFGPSASYASRREEEERFGGGIASSRAPIVIAFPAPTAEDTDRGYGMFE
jgi:negative regulator of sigma E activity